MPLLRDLAGLARLRDFRRLLTVRVLSQASDGVFQAALATYVVFSPEKQASPAAVATAMAVLLLPYSFLGPFAGVFLDRWRRRQTLLYCNLLRAALACGTAALLAARAPDWLFYASALVVTGVNRFVLAGLSASLPRVVGGDRLVTANSVSPTAGTVAATTGAGAAFVVHLLLGGGAGADAVVVLVSAALYLGAALATSRMAVGLLGPDPDRVLPHLGTALASTARGLAAGARHLAERRRAACGLAAMATMRFAYGALTVMVLMLCRYAWGPGGAALLGAAVAVSGAGFFLSALVTPWGAGRFGTAGWITVCAAAAAVLVPVPVLSFEPLPVLAAAFVLGAATQGAKIATDTIVQTTVDDEYRGRIFSLYDVLFNVAFVGAAAVASLVLPADGRSAGLVVGVALLHGAVSLAAARFPADPAGR
ncbi:MFS transporter [Streptomyces sp. SCUT-3]|uniref:MFS transporter n=1 Tax=Streptomyces sp. SCUT-3 TaxID=2684469 RepID=UPI000CAA6BD5|nr:MFS transporter [Streptomyces sp. SCUT-3]PLW74751.1 MFS transporter [Streptomyces sp. DJ]QMV22521.1 MFS transporter [Streptomyces sp. SCUT-3]